MKNSVVKFQFNYTSSSPACFLHFCLKKIETLHYKTAQRRLNEGENYVCSWVQTSGKYKELMSVLSLEDYCNGYTEFKRREKLNMESRVLYYKSGTDIDKYRGLREQEIYGRKFILEQATRAQRGSRCIAILFLQPRHLDVG